MAKKLISFDDEVEGIGLPEVVEERMSHTFVQAPIDLAGRGMSHINTATANTAIIREAITEAEGTGRQIILPHCPPTAWIDVDGALTVPGGMSIIGHGAERTRIRQLARMAPLFDVIGPDVEVAGFTGKQTTENPTSAEKAFWRGEPGTGKLAVVRVQADRVDVEDVTGVDANAVVHFAAWDVTANAKRSQLAQCRAVNIHSIDCVFGLLAVGVEDFYFDNVTGNYLLRPGWGTPPHLLYFSEGLGDNIDIRGGTAYAKNGIDGQAFQFKGVKGGNISSLRARDCDGLLNLILNEDLEIDTLISMGDNYTGEGTGSLTLQGVNKRVTIQDVTIHMAASGKPVRIVEGQEDVKISRLNVVSKHTAESTTGGLSFDVDIHGTRTEIHDVTVRNVGPVAWASSIGIFGGTDNRIIRPMTSGNNFGVYVRGTTTSGAVIEDYSLDELVAKNRSFSISRRTVLFPRRHAGATSPEHTPTLMEDGSTTSGNFGLVRWPQVGPEWQQLVGEWRADTTGLISQIHTLNSTLLVAPIDRADVTVSADVQYGSREGLAVRATDRGNMLIGRLNHITDTLEIVKRSESANTVLASVPFSPTIGNSYLMRFSALGDRLRLSVNGESLVVEHVLSPEDMALFPSTAHGLFAANYDTGGGYRNVMMY